LIENYLPRQLKKFGLEYKDLQAINDRLIYCSITGFNFKKYHFFIILFKVTEVMVLIPEDQVMI